MGRHKKKRRKAGGIEVLEECPRARGPSVVPLRPSGSSQSPSRTASVVARIRDVRLAIEKQSSKSALEKAKQLHKELGHKESKELLIDAYVARIEAMLAKDLMTEAKALADLVASRFPEAADRLAHLRRNLAARLGDVAAVIEPLTHPELSSQSREEAEQAIRHGLVDLQALATSAALPEDHPLRRAAAALDRAFAAVTTGDVDDAVISLPEVSHRNPLANWKSLIRAIAHLYRGQDEECRRFLAAIDNNSAPARIADSVRAIIDESADGQLTQAGRNLVQRILGPRAELRNALRALDAAFARPDYRELYRQVRKTVLICQRACPQMLKPLRKHIFIKAHMVGCQVEAISDALGGQTVHDACFWRLFARTVEGVGDYSYACVLWDRFRNAAIIEGLFTADGQESAFLYLHMAQLVRQIPPQHLPDVQEDYRNDLGDWDDFYHEEEPPLRSRRLPSSRKEPDMYFLYPEQLYERAAALRSDAGIYKEWLDYASAADGCDVRPDEVAQKWAAAFPQDPRPLLHLVEAAEQRNAFDKALKYIQQAEKLGGINPKVRRARFRLLVAKVVRHLKQAKAHLAAKDFGQIEQLPQASEKDRPAFVASLQWINAMLQDDRAEAERLHSQIRDNLGGPVAAAILLLSTAGECRYVSAETNRLQMWLTAYKEKDIIDAIVRTCPIAIDVDVEIILPAKWASLLARWLKRSDCGLDANGLMTMAEAALTTGWKEAAYYCSGYGLKRAGPEQARFMFLRGRSLPYSLYERRRECFAAAAELAKRLRDTDLVAEIADTTRREVGPWGWSKTFAPDLTDLNDLGTDDDTLRRVTEFERGTQKYPKESRLPFFAAGQACPGKPCQCPDCRRARGETGGYGTSRRGGSRRKARPAPSEEYLFEGLFDAEPEEEYEEYDETMAAAQAIPPDLAPLLAVIMRLTGGRLPASKEEIEKFARRNPELAMKLNEVLGRMPQAGLDPFDEFEPDDDNPWDLAGDSPRPPRGPRRRRKRKRKQ